MNLIFWRNVFCVAVIVTFVLDIFFGNGVANWSDWICGAAFLVAIDNLLSTADEHFGKQKIYTTDEFVANAASVLVIGSFVVALIFVENLWNWFDWFSGAACAYAVKILSASLGKFRSDFDGDGSRQKNFSRREVFDVKNKLKKIFQRLGRTGFLFLWLIPFAMWGLYHNGIAGLLATILGWCIGGFIYNRWLDKIFFKDKPQRVR